VCIHERILAIEGCDNPNHVQSDVEKFGEDIKRLKRLIS
jgi:hypothetical protein